MESSPHLIKFRLKWLKPALLIYAFTFALISVFLLVSCKTSRPTVSLDEAKQISIQFSDISFAPPPRSTNDLRPIIDIYSSEVEMGNCNSEPREPLEEISKKYGSAPPFPHHFSKPRMFQRMAMLEFEQGNYSRSVKLQKMAIKALPPEGRASYGLRYSQLSKLHAHAGDLGSAKKALNTAQSWFAQTSYSSGWTRYWLNYAKAFVEQLKGNLFSAEQYFRKTMDACKEVERRKLAYYLKIDQAENLLLQGRLLEAEILARELVTGAQFNIGETFIDGKVLLVLARILYEQGRYAEAEYVAKASVNAYLSSLNVECSSIFLNLANQTIARSLMAQGDWDKAVAQFEAIQEAMEDDTEAFEIRFLGNIDWALALLATGRTQEAATMLQQGLQRTEKQLGKKHYQTAKIRGLIAITLTTMGKRERALEEFQAVMPMLLSRFRQANDKGLDQVAQDQHLTMIFEGYMELLADICDTKIESTAGIDAKAIAFSLADKARNQSVLRALGANASRALMKEPELSDLARREQDAQKQISVVYSVLVNAMAQREADRDQKVIQSLRTKVDRLRDARITLIDEIENRFPEYAQLINPNTLSLRDLQSSLIPGETLVSVYIGRNRSFVWALPYRGKVYFASVPINRHVVGNMVARVRYALEPNAKTLGEIPRFDLEAASSLYQTFFEPVKKGWQDANNLLVVLHGALGYLPLSLLPTMPTKLVTEKGVLFQNYQKVPWLVRSHAITVLPSVSSLTTLRSLPPSDPDQRAFVGFGDPYFSEQQAQDATKPKEGVQTAAIEKRDDYGLRGISIERIKTAKLDSADLALLPRLPGTADEIRSIALALNADLTKDVYTGIRANEQQVKTMDLSAYKVVAFATHGLAPGDLNGLHQPALALSSPKVSGIEGDGLLTMGEILSLRLNADWVILSACNTGAGKEEGAEALSGLGRAFFYAGARALLVSNWPVETTSAKALTTNLFKIQKENPSMTRTEALRQSMLSLINGEDYVDPASGKVVFSYAHPIFWAPFTLVGDGIGTTQ